MQSLAGALAEEIRESLEPEVREQPPVRGYDLPAFVQDQDRTGHDLQQIAESLHAGEPVCQRLQLPGLRAFAGEIVRGESLLWGIGFDHAASRGFSPAIDRRWRR